MPSEDEDEDSLFVSSTSEDQARATVKHQGSSPGATAEPARKKAKHERSPVDLLMLADFVEYAGQAIRRKSDSEELEFRIAALSEKECDKLKTHKNQCPSKVLAFLDTGRRWRNCVVCGTCQLRNIGRPVELRKRRGSRLRREGARRMLGIDLFP